MEKIFSRRHLLQLGLGATALGVLGTPKKTMAAAKYKWRMQTHWPTGVAYYKLFYEGFCNSVRAASGGEIDITPLPPGAIVATKDVFEAVGRGLFEIAWSFPAYWIGKCPVAGHLNGQLFTWNNFEEMQMYFYQMGAMDIIKAAYAEFNLYPLHPQPSSGVALYSKRPIQTLADFKGLKVRSTGIPAEVFKKAGATPVFFPGEELYQALQTGVCEAAHWGGVAAGWEMRFQEVTSYIIRPFLVNVTNCEIFVNLDTWKKLPDNLKAILENVATSIASKNHTWFTYYDYIRMQEFEEKKMGKIVWMDPASIKTLTRHSIEVVDEYSKKDPKYCAKAGTLLKDFLKLVGRLP